MMLYLEDEAIDEDDLRAAVKSAVLAGSLAPVLPMSATAGVGPAEVLRLIADVLPDPSEAPPIAEGLEDNGEAGAFVFKTTADEFVGRLSYLRVVSGSVNSDEHLDNAQSGEDERLSGLSRPFGKTLNAVGSLEAGDMGVVTKLQHTTTFNTLRAKGSESGGAAAVDAGADFRGRGRAQDEGRRGQTRAVAGAAGGERSDAADRARPRLGRDDSERFERVARAAVGGSAGEQVPRRGGHPRSQRAVSGDGQRLGARRSICTRSRRAAAVSTRGWRCGSSRSLAARGSSSRTRSSAARCRATTFRRSRRAWSSRCRAGRSR